MKKNVCLVLCGVMVVGLLLLSGPSALMAKTVELKGFEGSQTLWYVEGPR